MHQPLVIIFNNLDELKQVVMLSNNLHTGTYIVNIGIRLIKNFNDFEKGLTEWFDQLAIQHTLFNFKTHYEREYQALKRVRGTTMRSTSYFHQVNTITVILEGIQQDRMEILNKVKDTEEKILRDMQLLRQNFKMNQEIINPLILHHGQW